MIEQRLINIINSGRAWAFVGSGASVDAGLPTWQDMYIRVVRTLENTAPPQAPPPATLPNSFGQLITQHGRTQVLSQVANHLTTTTLPGPVHHMLASWPFAAYVTTNYDRLLGHAGVPIVGLRWQHAEPPATFPTGTPTASSMLRPTRPESSSLTTTTTYPAEDASGR